MKGTGRAFFMTFRNMTAVRLCCIFVLFLCVDRIAGKVRAFTYFKFHKLRGGVLGKKISSNFSVLVTKFGSFSEHTQS